MRIGVIMAGGSGERFWPLSRRARPKQLLNLTTPDRSLLAEAVERLTPLIPIENILVVTGRHLVEPIRLAKLGVPDQNIIGEPFKRNTAGCLAYTAVYILTHFKEKPENISMAVVTADHVIRGPARFRAALEAAFAVSEKQDALVTIGIRPTRPETGYGYIELAAGSPSSGTDPSVPVFPAARFREKPDLRTAQQYMHSGLHLWNSGMFFWKLSTFLRELRLASPDIAAAVDTMHNDMVSGNLENLDLTFIQLPDTSIDYALMEKASCVYVAQGDFPWDDIGAWDALDRTFPHDAQGNVAIGDPVLIDTKNSIVYNDPGAAWTAVGVLGMENVVVVVAGDAVLVVPKSRAQAVKKLMVELKSRGAKQL